MAYFRCIGGNGGGTTQAICSGRFGTTNGLKLNQGKWLSGFSSGNIFFPRKEDGSNPVYDNTKKRHISVRFSINGTITGESQGIVGTQSAYDKHAPQINVYPSNGTNFCVIGWSSDGNTNTTWMTFSKQEIPYSTSNIYTLDAIWENGTLTGTVSDGTNTITKTATDGNQYISSSDSASIALGYRQYGAIYAAQIEIDLSATYWEENGVVLWGNKPA